MLISGECNVWVSLTSMCREKSIYVIGVSILDNISDIFIHFAFEEVTNCYNCVKDGAYLQGRSKSVMISDSYRS